MNKEQLIRKISDDLESHLDEVIAETKAEEAWDGFHLHVNANGFLYREVGYRPLDVDVYLYEDENKKTIGKANLEDSWMEVINDDPLTYKNKALRLASELERIAKLMRRVVRPEEQ